MTDMITWLRAQLDEDEAAVLLDRGGHPGPHTADPERDPTGADWPGNWPEDQRPQYEGWEPCALCVAAANANPYRGHPDFGLADIAAKRAILDEHSPVDGLVWDSTGNETHNGKVCGTCSGVDHRDTERPMGDAYPCKTLRWLAYAYRHRPGYLPEWAPEGARS